MKQYIDASTQVIDLKGATVLPGLIDSHVHIAELGAILERVNLNDVTSPEEAIAKMLAYAEGHEAGEWLIGQG